MLQIRDGVTTHAKEKPDPPASVMQVREEATAKLDSKIASFKVKVSKMSDAQGDTPKLALLKTHFDSSDMGALWGEAQDSAQARGHEHR